MKTRVLSILILFLLITSVSIPVVSAKEASKNTIESTIEEDIKFVIESIHEYGKVQKMAIESPIMQEININGAIGAAEGAAIGAKGVHDKRQQHKKFITDNNHSPSKGEHLPFN